MEAFEQILQELTAATFGLSADDLPALGHVHSLLDAFVAALPPSQTWTSAAEEMSGDAKKLVEKLILHDVTDAEESIRQLVKASEELHKLISDAGATSDSDAASTTAPVEAFPSEATVPEQSDLIMDSIDPQDAGLVAEFIQEAGEHIESSEAALLKLDQDPGDSEAVNALFRAFHTIKGVAGFLKLAQIGALAHAVENLMDQARSGSLRLRAESIDALLRSVDLMKTMLGSLDAAVKSATNPPAQPELASLLATLRACTQSGAANAPMASTHTRAPAARRSATVAPATPPIEETVAAPASAEPQAPVVSTPARGGAGTSSTDSVVKVSTERLDSLINAIGELVIAQAMVRQDVASLVPANHRVLRTLNLVGKIARELQDLSMSMRMVPIQGVFQKMSRLVRDLARKSGKEFELEIVGGETELDRGLVETISDPLVHMVRNSADHGIESPDEREKAGKPRCGLIQLRAYHQAGNVVVEIRDDGRGLNKAKILRKAQERGIVPAGKELSEQEIFNLVFAPGLSTAEQVTEVSGRGVGMDVVLRNVESLRGRIDIASTEGRGSTFTIRLPLTLAVIDGLVVRVGDERYVIPITSIEQILRPRAEQVSTIQNRGEICMVRDHLLPLVRLHQLFEVRPRHLSPSDGLLVIVQSGPTRCCLLVDELLGQQQVVIKALGSGVGQTRGISGGAILGDGRVSLILDVPGIIASASTN